jgi:DNA-binding MarR family transcriptional regulator
MEHFSRNDSLGFWIYRVHCQGSAALRRAFQAAGYDLTPEQFGLLSAIREHEGLHQSQLGERTFKDRHNVTRILNLLEKQGYIERRPHSTDKRVYRIFLTTEGRGVQTRLAPIIINHVERCFAGISAEDRAAMRRILEHVARNIDRDAGGGR